MAERTLAFMTRASDEWEQSEAGRSALGAMLRGHTPSLFVLDAEINPEYGDNAENFEWIVDSDGVVGTNSSANDGKENIEVMSVEDIAKKILELDFVIPY
jgi:hypothetical protein